ncbi:MAG: hypothetical protein ACP5GJ_02670 [Nanopusillaceae archaeon]
MVRFIFKKLVQLFLLIFLSILVSHNVYSIQVTTSYSFDITVSNNKLIINYTYQGYNYLCTPISMFGCGQGLFFRVFIYDPQGTQIQAFRTGKDACITDLSSTQCDIPYNFDNKPISGSTSVSLNLQPGTYNIKVEYVVDLAWAPDQTLASKSITYILQPQQISQPQQNQTLYSSPSLSITSLGPLILPQSIVAGQTTNITIPLQMKSNYNTGIVLWVYIKDSNGQQVLSTIVTPNGYIGGPTTVFGSYYVSGIPGYYTLAANVPVSLNVTVSFTPPSEGSYYVYVWPMVPTTNAGIVGVILVPATTIPVMVGSFNVTSKIQPQQYAITVSSGDVIISLGNITISPNPGSVGQEMQITFPVYVKVLSGGAYGPTLYVYIEDVKGQVVAFYRLGSQGYTTDSNVNYYFPNTPQGVYQFYNITVSFVPKQPGTFFIYVLPRYNVQYWTDYDLGPKTLVATFTVNQSQTSSGICTTGQPVLVKTAWLQNGVVVTSAAVGQGVVAYAEFTNPSTCTYVGSIVITVYTTGLFGSQQQYATYTTSINLPPGQSVNVTYQITFPTAGTYYFGVTYQIPTYSYKYKPQDVQTIAGYPAQNEAGPTIQIKAQPSITYSVSTFYFVQNGRQTTQLVEGSPVQACVVLTANEPSQAQVTLNVFSHNTLGLEIGGGLWNNLWAVQQGTYTITPNGTTVCATFTPRQSSWLHQDCWYLVVYVNGQRLGKFPESESGACVITKKQYVEQNVQILSSGWYTQGGVQVTKGSWITGIYYVNVTFANAGEVDVSVPVEITINTPGGFFGLIPPSTVRKCSEVLSLKPNSTATMSCSANLPDGKYYYEIIVNGKTAQTGPTITIGFIEHVKEFFTNLLTIIGITGVVLIILFIFFGPYIIKGLTFMFIALKDSVEQLIEIIKRIRRR